MNASLCSKNRRVIYFSLPKTIVTWPHGIYIISTLYTLSEITYNVYINVHDYSILNENAVHPVIFEGWHFIGMWKALL
jgi:hypothetical protein